eukprot:2995141-Pyramimonas_sp.AAC.1
MRCFSVEGPRSLEAHLHGPLLEGPVPHEGFFEGPFSWETKGRLENGPLKVCWKGPWLHSGQGQKHTGEGYDPRQSSGTR